MLPSGLAHCVLCMPLKGINCLTMTFCPVSAANWRARSIS